MTLFLSRTRSLNKLKLPAFCSEKCHSSASSAKPLDIVSSAPSRIFISSSHDPWFNLSFEDWLFRKSNPSVPMLFMYRNRPSIVLGRNQNPWKEINLPALQSADIPFVRRRSGGGTVYHDLGNTNYSALVPKSTFTRAQNASLVARALSSPPLLVPAEMNERNDITLEGKKISGSAYKLSGKRAYHHGTMLIEAELGVLGECLRSGRSFSSSKGTDSVRSPVMNITSSYPHVNHDSFVQAVIREFRSEYDVEEGSQVIDVREDSEGEGMDEVRKEAEDLKSWKWAYGQTPEFSVELSKEISSFGHIDATVTSKHGLITAVVIRCPESEDDMGKQRILRVVEERLVGRRFGEQEGLDMGEEKKESTQGLGPEECEMLDWIIREM